MFVFDLIRSFCYILYALILVVSFIVIIKLKKIKPIYALMLSVIELILFILNLVLAIFDIISMNILSSFLEIFLSAFWLYNFIKSKKLYKVFLEYENVKRKQEEFSRQKTNKYYKLIVIEGEFREVPDEPDNP